MKPKHKLMYQLSVFLFSIAMCGCASLKGGITYFDANTYQHLTDLKPEVAFLYDGFTSDSVDENEIKAVRLKLSQAYEYEKGKGEKNKETIDQFEIIFNMFNRNVKERLEKGKWNTEHVGTKKENISRAFDIAIETENIKNRR